MEGLFNACCQDPRKAEVLERLWKMQPVERLAASLRRQEQFALHSLRRSLLARLSAEAAQAATEVSDLLKKKKPNQVPAAVDAFFKTISTLALPDGERPQSPSVATPLPLGNSFAKLNLF